MKMKKKKDVKQDLLIIDAETGLLSHSSTLECVSPNSGILFPNLFGASSERITLSTSVMHSAFLSLPAKSDGSRTFLSCELRGPVGQKGTYFHCGVTLPSD